MLVYRYARCHAHEVNKIVTLCYVMLETVSSTYSTSLCLQFFYLMCHASGHFDLQCLPNVFKMYCRGNSVICEVVTVVFALLQIIVLPSKASVPQCSAVSLC